MSKRYETIKRVTIVIDPNHPWQKISYAIEYCERNGYKVNWPLTGRRRGKYRVIGEKVVAANVK